jgi:hypothetical protein
VFVGARTSSPINEERWTEARQTDLSHEQMIREFGTHFGGRLVANKWGHWKTLVINISLRQENGAPFLVTRSDTVDTLVD